MPVLEREGQRLALTWVAYQAAGLSRMYRRFTAYARAVENRPYTF